MVPVSDRIDHYDEVLLREEGEGILALIVQGAIAHLKGLEKQGDFTLSASQKERVDSLLTQSQSLRFFVRDEIYANPESDLTTDETPTLITAARNNGGQCRENRSNYNSATS